MTSTMLQKIILPYAVRGGWAISAGQIEAC